MSLPTMKVMIMTVTNMIRNPETAANRGGMESANPKLSPAAIASAIPMAMPAMLKSCATSPFFMPLIIIQTNTANVMISKKIIPKFRN